MAARYVLTVVVAALLGRPAAAGFCTAQRSLLAAEPDALVMGRQRSCGLGDRWLSEHESADMLYSVHDLGYGNNTSLAAWLQIAARGNSSSSTSSGPQPSLKVTTGMRPSAAGWRWDWLVSNTTAAERRFQQRVSSVLVRPLVKFSARLGGDVPPAALSALLRQLVTESRPAVLDALREVTGKGGPERLLNRGGGIVRTVASAVTELVVLSSGAAQQIRWAAAPYLSKVNTSSSAADNTSQTANSTSSAATNASASDINSGASSPTTNSTSDTPTASSQPEEPAASSRPSSRLAAQSALMGRVFRSLSVSSPDVLGATTLLAAVPVVVLSLYLLFSVPAALLMAAVLYGGLLLASSLARGMVDGETAESLVDGEAGLLLGKAVEAVLGGLFRMRLLRTLLMFALEGLVG